MSLEGADSSTRERLLEAAIMLFARQGYEATSIADIQRACGLAPGSGALYKHFSSKRELLEVATRRYVDRLTERVFENSRWAGVCRAENRRSRLLVCVRDYETRPDHDEAMVHLAMITTMTRRLART